MKLAIGTLAALLVIDNTGILTAQAPPDQPELPSLLSTTPLKVDPNDDEMRKLLKARYNEAVGEVVVRFKMYIAGARGGASEALFTASDRLLRAGMEVFDSPAEKVAFLTENLGMAKAAEMVSETKYKAGAVDLAELHRARYYRLDAEIQLLRFKRMAKAPKTPGK